MTGVQCKENIERPEVTLQYTSTLRPRACLYLFPYFRVCVCVCAVDFCGCNSSVSYRITISAKTSN